MKLKYKDSIDLKELEFNKNDILTIITAIHSATANSRLSLSDNRIDILNQLNELIGIDTNTIIDIHNNIKSKTLKIGDPFYDSLIDKYGYK